MTLVISSKRECDDADASLDPRSFLSPLHSCIAIHPLCSSESHLQLCALIWWILKFMILQGLLHLAHSQWKVNEKLRLILQVNRALAGRRCKASSHVCQRPPTHPPPLKSTPPPTPSRPRLKAVFSLPLSFWICFAGQNEGVNELCFWHLQNMFKAAKNLFFCACPHWNILHVTGAKNYLCTCV